MDSPNEAQGDYILGDAAFHVRTTLFSDAYEKCSQDAVKGLRTYLLVPEYILAAVKLHVQFQTQGTITVESIESFVGTGIEFQSMFSRRKLAQQVLRLLETYNQRVLAMEQDLSILIQIPRLLRSQSKVCAVNT